MEDKKKTEDKQTSQKYKISNTTKDRVAACKAYIERKYEKQIQEDMGKKHIWDKIFKNMNELNFSNKEKDIIKKEILKKEAEQLRKKRQKMVVQDFEPIAIIGRGAFGEVRVCRDKQTREVVAVKKMKKQDMIVKNQLGHIRAERDILASSYNPWIVDLKCSFQDDQSLYLVMEFLGGGDLMTLLIKQDILTEDVARFYIAELILSVESLHMMNFIHRDLKPDNVLIDNEGHLKLSDFGLCKHMGVKPDQEIQRQIDRSSFNSKNEIKNDISPSLKYKRNRQLAYSTVGTPDYIAPEVFNQKGYSESVDWWSVGVILFEMVVGYPPFFSDTPQQTCQKIISWKKYFTIPQEAKLSILCQDLIKKLMSDNLDRLGQDGSESIKNHSFFKNIDWANIRSQKAPFIPDLSSLTKNFDKFNEEDPWNGIPEDKSKRGRKVPFFQGYTFKRSIENQKSPLALALEELENIRPSTVRAPLTTEKVTSYPLQKQKHQSPLPSNIPSYLQNQIPSNLSFIPSHTNQGSPKLNVSITIYPKQKERENVIINQLKVKTQQSNSPLNSWWNQKLDQTSSPFPKATNVQSVQQNSNNQSFFKKCLLGNFKDSSLSPKPMSARSPGFKNIRYEIPKK